MNPLSLAALGALLSQAGTPMPAPVNNRIIGCVDSRTAQCSENSNSAAMDRATAQGYLSWAHLAAECRGQLVGNYGINTDTIDGGITRLTAAGISGGTAPSDPRRGWINTYDPGLSAGIFVMLVGVNNTTQNIATTGPKYDSLIMGLCDGGPGRVGLILNEVPNSDQSGQGATNYARRQYLDGWPYTSTTMTSGQKSAYAAKVRVINTYDYLANPASVYYPRSGQFQDTLHPGAGGACSIGLRVLGSALKQLLAQGGFQARNALIAADNQSLNPNWQMTGSVAVSASNGETGGTVGNNMDGQGGACVTGVLPTSWVVGRSATIRTLLNNGAQGGSNRLNVECSKVLDSDGSEATRMRITGQIGTSGGTIYSVTLGQANRFVNTAGMANLNAGVGLADGDSIAGVCGVKIAAGHRGMTGFGPESYCGSASFAGSQSARAILSGAIGDTAKIMDGCGAIDLVLLCQPQVLPAGFVAAAESKTISNNCYVYLAGGTPLDIDIQVRRYGLAKNR